MNQSLDNQGWARLIFLIDLINTGDASLSKNLLKLIWNPLHVQVQLLSVTFACAERSTCYSKPWLIHLCVCFSQPGPPLQLLCKYKLLLGLVRF